MSYPALSSKLQIVRFEGNNASTDHDEVVTEHALRLCVNGTLFATFSCSPAHMEALIAGSLFVKGVIQTASDLTACVFSADGAEALVTVVPSAHGSARPSPAPDLRVSAADIYALMTQNLTASTLFQRTGGVHSVALFCGREKLVRMEDMARHNAVDKALGYAVLNRIPLETATLVVSGRISSDMLEKACAAGIPLVLSKGAPTDKAVRLAQAHKITLAGFVRGMRMNVYTCPERITE